MKRILAVLLTLIIAFSACSYNVEEPEIPVASPEEPEKEIPVKEEIVPEHIKYFRENFPVIDGSTSLIPLEAGIRSEIFGCSFDEAAAQVTHSGTWNSFVNLIDGNADMIFSCQLSEEQWKMADDAGINLEAIPVAMEGFVFVVNAKNPVDELTQEQIRMIYSGAITNWKEVGGNDEEIIAYQRNNDSGSQNFMISFMKGLPLMDAPTYQRIGSMGGLMDAVAINDNAENSIGYSVYAYAADMYGNGDEIKFIKVDGVEVTKETIMTEEYPLCGYNYAVYPSAEPENGPVRKLVEWMTSEEGQTAVAKAGYVTVRDVGYDYSKDFLPFEAEGTGIGKVNPYEKAPNYEWKIKNEHNASHYLTLYVGTHSDGTKTYIMNMLSNKELEQEINKFIRDNVNKLEERYDEFEEFVRIIAGEEEDDFGNTYGKYNIGLMESYYGAYTKGEKTGVIVKAKNGYISVAVTLPYYLGLQDGADLFYDTETAVWDMISGERLELTDLFYEGTDVDKVLNDYIKIAAETQGMTEFNIRYNMKRDFFGLPDDEYWHMDLDRIYFDIGNMYFYDGAGISLDELESGVLVTEKPRDMTKCFTQEYAKKVYKTFTSPSLSVKYRYLDEKDKYEESYGQLRYAVLDEKIYPNAKKINDTVEKYLKENMTREKVLEYYKDYELTDDDKAEIFIWDGWYIEPFGSKYVIFDGSKYLYTDWHDEYYTSYTSVWYDKNRFFIFDLDTGEEKEWTELLTPKGLEKAKANKKLETVGSIHMTENGISVVDGDFWDSVDFTGDEVKW